MEIINQPFQQALGFQLIDALRSEKYCAFRFAVAYAKTSGVNRLLPYMQQFKSAGGQIEGVVGIDQCNTSYEALQALSSVCGRLYVYHSEDWSRTFHVKAYCFEEPSGKSWLAIGSNNFTAGGLFGNYEASIAAKTDGAMVQQFQELFQHYSDVNSSCCKAADQPFIELLLDQRYIYREVDLAKQRIAQRNSDRSGKKHSVLFGHESTASAPRINLTAPIPSVISSATGNMSMTLPLDLGGDYLIRHVPKAGGRSKQVHFTFSILNNYFHLSPGDQLILQQVNGAGIPSFIEHRQVVLSPRNQNVKVEVAGAAILDDHYPDDLTKRPILVFRRVQPTMFEYVLLMDGDPGYDRLNGRLLSLNLRGNSLPFEIVDTKNMLELWSGCPLL